VRLYETRGLIRPDRTPGGTRRYSQADLHRLKRIVELINEGVNLAGVAMILTLEDANAGLSEQLAAAHDQLTATRQKLAASLAAGAGVLRRESSARRTRRSETGPDPAAEEPDRQRR
jgi:DNA-binding transcriptional MerR regulator